MLRFVILKHSAFREVECGKKNQESMSILPIGKLPRFRIMSER